MAAMTAGEKAGRRGVQRVEWKAGLKAASKAGKSVEWKVSDWAGCLVELMAVLTVGA